PPTRKSAAASRCRESSRRKPRRLPRPTPGGRPFESKPARRTGFSSRAREIGKRMLITTCTHCLARFRVSPQQLNAKQGQVRCGRCRKVFNGFEALERYPDDDTGSRLLAAREAQLKESHPSETSESVPLEETAEPIAAPSPLPDPAPIA